MITPIQKIHLNSSDTELILEELRLVKQEISALVESNRVDKKRDKLFAEWIHESEVMELTGLSRNTLYNLWKTGRVAKSSIAGKANYYKMSDFKKLLNENQFK